MFQRVTVFGMFLANVLLGNFCMMPMAMAAAMPMQNEDEMDVMTPVEPMTSAHCEHCAHLQKEQPAPMNGGCAGHCLSKAHEAGSIMVENAGQSLLGAALPPSVAYVIPEESMQSFVEANAPPPSGNPARTIVLLQ